MFLKEWDHWFNFQENDGSSFKLFFNSFFRQHFKSIFNKLFFNIYQFNRYYNFWRAQGTWVVVCLYEDGGGIKSEKIIKWQVSTTVISLKTFRCVCMKSENSYLLSARHHHPCRARTILFIHKLHCKMKKTFYFHLLNYTANDQTPAYLFTFFHEKHFTRNYLKQPSLKAYEIYWNFLIT